ncbi:MAG: hypothetical protein R3F19_12750 [Verrucomicrobiales bacterium]
MAHLLLEEVRGFVTGSTSMKPSRQMGWLFRRTPRSLRLTNRVFWVASSASCGLPQRRFAVVDQPYAPPRKLSESGLIAGGAELLKELGITF